MRHLSIILCLLIASSCNEIYEGEKIPSPSLFPESFDYQTTEDVGFDILTKDNRGLPIANVRLSIYGMHNGSKQLLSTGQTNADGTYAFNHSVGNHIDSLSIETNYLGLPSERLVATPIVQDIVLGGVGAYASQGRSESGRGQADSFTYIGSYDNQGVPYYLEPVDDYISQDLLDVVNNSLPEGFPVPTFNPEYIDDEVSSDTQLSETADVWVTFVHEGAGWRNALGYYTYDLDSPPTRIDDIDELHLIFPNVSFNNSGGGMESGNKVYLGSFPANTGIGWFLVPNGWNGSNVSFKDQIKFSNRDFNDFTAEQYRTHTVLLRDEKRQILLLGMEDTSRPGGDNDFNDAVFYVSANPFSAVITDGLVETTTNSSTDTDGDGVADVNDSYPNDANKAFDIYTPGENIFGSVAFEDLYPAKGDFDMNDMVVDYNFQSVANVSNEVVELRASFKVKALGATIHSGYGFTLPVPPSAIQSITGQDVLTGEEISLSANGTETGQSQAVILLFEDAFRAWSSAYGRTNTISSNGYAEPLELNLVISFAQPVSTLSLGYAPYDPFLFHTQDRALEVHLATGSATDKADFTFGARDDRGQGNNYLTTDNLPYAINLPVTFDYPEEEQSMSDAFSHFNTWAQSANTSYRDWYMDRSGYRVTSKVYKKP